MNAPARGVRAGNEGGRAPTVRTRVVNSRLRVGASGGPGGTVTLVQCDATTCGAASVLAARLLLRGGGPVGTSSAPLPPGRALLEALGRTQRRLQRTMNRRADGPAGPLAWPRALGSTPWSVARALGEALGVRYRVRWVRGPCAGCGQGRGARREPGRISSADVGTLRAALAAGDPVVLLTGTRLLPRHYVLALPPEVAGGDPGPGRARVYDPSSGSVGVLDLRAPHDPSVPGPRELGYWPEVLALILPQSTIPEGRP